MDKGACHIVNREIQTWLPYILCFRISDIFQKRMLQCVMFEMKLWKQFNGMKEKQLVVQDQQDNLSTVDIHAKLLCLTAPSFTFDLRWFSSVKAVLPSHRMMEQQSIQCVKGPVLLPPRLTSGRVMTWLTALVCSTCD